jgi:hypothetical protein
VEVTFLTATWYQVEDHFSLGYSAYVTWKHSASYVMLNYRAASCFSRTAKIGIVFEVIDGLTGNVIELGMS